MNIKKSLLIIVLGLMFSFNANATEQRPDLLIINKDTFYLKSFPFNDIIKHFPFTYYDKYTFPHTGCWRGYIATWKIIDNKLFLLEVKKADRTEEKLDILKYFESINYTPVLIDGLIMADWYSDTLVDYVSYNDLHLREELYLEKHYRFRKNAIIQLIFNQGRLIENRIQDINSYKPGEILWRDIYYSSSIFQDNELAKVRVKILKNNGSLVKVEILDYGTSKKYRIKKIKYSLGIKNEEDNWFNPRYWNKENNPQ